jgi:hypothetical protein
MKNTIKNRKEDFFTCRTFAIISIAFFILFTIPFAMAQQSTVSAGGNANGTGGTVSYTVGQVFFHTHEGEGGSVAEGLQQPYEIFVVTSIENIPDISVIVVAYPNPVTDNLMLVIKDQVDFSTETIHFRLSDINGSVIQSDKAAGRQTRIDMQNLPPAVYFLKVTDNRRELKTFKIVKN